MHGGKTKMLFYFFLSSLSTVEKQSNFRSQDTKYKRNQKEINGKINKQNDFETVS